MHHVPVKTATEPNPKKNMVYGTLCRSWLYNLSLCPLLSRLQHIYPMPESTLSSSQGLWIWPQVVVSIESSKHHIEPGMAQRRHKRSERYTNMHSAASIHVSEPNLNPLQFQFSIFPFFPLQFSILSFAIFNFQRHSALYWSFTVTVNPLTI
jgi:hypothetical protein